MVQVERCPAFELGVGIIVEYMVANVHQAELAVVMVPLGIHGRPRSSREGDAFEVVKIPELKSPIRPVAAHGTSVSWIGT